MKSNYTISAPSWQPDAIPTSSGWVHPVTKELLVSVKGGIEQWVIDAYQSTLIKKEMETPAILKATFTPSKVEAKVEVLKPTKKATKNK